MVLKNCPSKTERGIRGKMQSSLCTESALIDRALKVQKAWEIALELAMLFLAFIFLSLRSRLLGPKFDNDAETIYNIAFSPFDIEGATSDSFKLISLLYRIARIDTPLKAGICGIVITFVTLLIATILLRHPGSRLIRLATISVSMLLSMVFIGTYTKELLISIAVLLIVFLEDRRRGAVAVSLVTVALGIVYRTYWLITTFFFVVVTVLAPRVSKRLRSLISLSLLALLAVSLAIYLYTGETADIARTVTNASGSRQALTGSLLGGYVDGVEPLSGIVNILLSLVFLVFPVPLISKASLYHIAIAGVPLIIWVVVFWGSGVGKTLKYGFVHSGFGIFVAFLLTQSLFEPDYGSALRHITPLLPLVLTLPIYSNKVRSGNEPENSGFEMESQMTSVSKTEPGSFISSNQWRKAIVESRYFVLIVAVLGLFAGLLFTFLVPPKYTASSTTYVAIKSEGTVADAYQATLIAEKKIASIAQLTKEDSVVDPVVERLNGQMDAKEVRDSITASIDPDTVLLTISGTSADPGLAKDLTQAVTDELTKTVGSLERTPSGNSSTELLPVGHVSVPDTPSSISAPVVIAIGTLGGAAVGLVLGVIKFVSDRRLKSRKDIEDIFGLPVLTSIPFDNRLETDHVIDTDSYSLAGEALRELRTSVRFFDVDNPPQIISISSSMPGEGKSTISLNFAKVLADDGYHVCLVEADLRKPRLSHYLGSRIIRDLGISTVLSGEVSLDDALQSTEFSNLEILPSGQIPPNPSEMVGSEAFTDILEQLRKRFDYVVVDTAPVGTLTDGAIIAAKSDASLLVVKIKQPTEDQVGTAIERLRSVNATLIGVISNGEKISKKNYYEDSYYSDQTV